MNRIYTTDDMKKDPALSTLAMLEPGHEVAEEVYRILQTSSRPLPLPFETRVHSPQGISEGFLYGTPVGSRPEGIMYLAFGMTRYRGIHYYYLGLSTIDGHEKSHRIDFRKVMSDPCYMLKAMKGIR